LDSHTRIEQVQEFRTNLNKLQDAYESLKNGDGPTDIGQELKNKMKESIDKSINDVNQFFED
jgi:hypothetical protein